MSTTPLSTELVPTVPTAARQALSVRRLIAELRSRKVALLGIGVLLLIVLIAIFAPLVAPHDPLKQNLGDNFKPPMWKEGGTSEYPLGTDPLGRDLLSRLIYGARYSLAISAGAVVLGSVIGFFVGLVAGFFGRWTDVVLMRLGDIQLAFPFVLFAIAVLAVSPHRNVWQIILVLGLSSWVIYARVVRSRVLAEREKDYARAARAVGASPLRVLFRYVMPNVWQAVPPICLLNLAFFVIVESLLSFLALGLSSPTPSWGAILADGRQFMMVSPWMAILPGIAILVTVLSISLAADELADVFDPKLSHGTSRRVPLPASGIAARHDPSAPLLRVRNLSTEFPTRHRTVRALRGVELDLERGKVLGIVGESGSGKSTLGLSIIQLLDSPGRVAEGEVLFQGIDLARSSNSEMGKIRGAKIGMVFQDPGNSLNPVLTVGYQLREALRCGGRSGALDLTAAARAALVAVNIADPDRVLRAYPFQLSGGMQQRVMIALAMVGRPDLLILDEPTSALDVTTQAQFLEELESLQAQTGMSMIFITHDIALLSDFADEILVLYAGKVCEVGASEALLQDPLHPYTKALLDAVQRTNVSESGRLAAIPGDPPDLAVIQPGCPFAARCPYVMPVCQQIEPPLIEIGGGHRAACHLQTAETQVVA
jgi:peptide/nickel transport system permease protein